MYSSQPLGSLRLLLGRALGEHELPAPIECFLFACVLKNREYSKIVSWNLEVHALLVNSEEFAITDLW